MIAKKYKFGLGVSVILCAMPIMAVAQEAEVYVIPDEAKCTVRKTDKITYCTDLNGAPITGELHRYQDNNLIRLYRMKEGVLDGTAITYYANGNPQSEKPYSNGVLNGVVREYYNNGSLQSETPYLNGQKEGVAKSYTENGAMFSQMIYSADSLNGEMRVYTPSGKTLYSFENNEDRLISGVYYFRRPNKGIDEVDIPDVIIQALNHACLELQTELTEDTCAVVYNGPLTTCDETWRKSNRTAVRKYLTECAKGIKDE